MGVGQILVDFCGWTSCHGVPHIGAASNWCLRSFWGVILIACACMFGWQFSLLYAKYTSYPVAVITSLNFQPLTFPAVLMCNINPYKKSKVSIDPSIGSETSGTGLLYNFNMAMEGKSGQTSALYGFQDINDTLALQAKAKDDLVYLMAANPSLITAASFNMSEIVVNCAYNTSACSFQRDFVTKSDPVYGNCFEFNANRTYGSNRAGPLYGLRVLLKSNQAEYLPMMESAGARISIHSQSQEAFPDAFGLNAAVGFTTSFALQYITTSRLSQPYGTCAKATGEFDYFYSGDYTVEGCFRSCYQKKAYQLCGCGDPRFILKMGGTTISPCTLSPNSCISNLSNPTLSGFNPIAKCTCPQPCFESSYMVTASNALWPAASFMPQECEVSPTSSLWNSQTECVQWYSANTLLVEVYFERMNFQSVTETPAYPLVSVISDLGGQLGLWMGLSVITLIEFLSLIILLIIYGVRVCMNSPGNPTVKNGTSVNPAEKRPPPYSPYENEIDLSNSVAPRPK